jgi:hypothetical protein
VRTEVYINDQLIDLSDESDVTATYGNISFGELSKRKGVKSNTWNAPFSQRNKLVFESCELSSSNSVIPYRKSTIRVEIDGVIAFEGFCFVDESGDNYEVQSFAGATDFYSLINKAKLTELNLSAYSNVWNEQSIRNSWSATEGYVYAFVSYGKENDTGGANNYPVNSVISPDYLLPQIFFSTVVKAIAIDAGYNLTGDVIIDDRFKRHVIIANNFPLPITYGSTFNIATLLPDLTQSKVWLDFANIYGLQFDIDDATKEIRATYIDDLLFNEPEEWTEKVDRSERSKTKYKLDSYGQSSFLRFKSDSSTDANACSVDYAKIVLIDDTTLDPEADIYKSEFYLIQNESYPLQQDYLPTTKTFLPKKDVAFFGVWDGTINYFFADYFSTYVWRNGTYYVLLQNTTVAHEDPISSPAFWQPKLEKDLWETKSRPMYGILVVDLYSPMTVAFDTPVNVNRVIFATGLDWDTSYTRHYRVFKRIIDKTKRVERLIKLNYADINQIRFDTLKIIDNELYILEEITQFKLNHPDSTICKFIRL